MALTTGIHQALTDFQLVYDDLSRRPTFFYVIVTLQIKLDGYHNASKYMCGGAVHTGPTSVTRNPK